MTYTYFGNKPQCLNKVELGDGRHSYCYMEAGHEGSCASNQKDYKTLDNKPRCLQVHPKVGQCQYPQGHVGMHIHGLIRW